MRPIPIQVMAGYLAWRERYGKQFEEDKHPRSNDGKFTSGGEGSHARNEKWNVSLDDWNKSAIDTEQASNEIAKIRAGDERSKNKGEKRSEVVRKPQVKTKIPLSAFPPEIIQFLKETTDEKRVNDYAAQSIDTPIVAFPRRNREGFSVSDGGHRLMAALTRGDKTIEAYVPLDAYEQVKKSHELSNQ